MLIFDELKKNDPQLRLVAMGLAAGFFILLAGLWWVQVVCGANTKAIWKRNPIAPSAMPAMRGKILDCEGRVMAENGARYNLEPLPRRFERRSSKTEYNRLRPIRNAAQSPAVLEILGTVISRAQSASLNRDEISVTSHGRRVDDVAYYVISHNVPNARPAADL